MTRPRLSFGIRHALLAMGVASALVAALAIYIRYDSRSKLRAAFGSVEAGDLIRLSERIEIRGVSWNFGADEMRIPEEVPSSACGELVGVLKPAVADSVRTNLLALKAYPRNLAVDVCFDAQACMRFVSDQGHVDLYYTDEHDIGLVVLRNTPQAVVFLNCFPQDPRRFVSAENLENP